jgi:hypothetical protein
LYFDPSVVFLLSGPCTLFKKIDHATKALSKGEQELRNELRLHNKDKKELEKKEKMEQDKKGKLAAKEKKDMEAEIEKLKDQLHASKRKIMQLEKVALKEGAKSIATKKQTSPVNVSTPERGKATSRRQTGMRRTVTSPPERHGSSSATSRRDRTSIKPPSVNVSGDKKMTSSSRPSTGGGWR